ncbi:hypothetical protein PC116_g16180 [Phytophthora cactorum]|uniref:Uncharacterized protein n=1 Tax=Phytophthora cactorum TaxID=29920 RepID=A0A8T1D3H9_9STRA|nr:hypothetical protein PC114_g13420 [Phytophthora cactorum]KAG2932892.1 hypothetical protein PC117_g13024 [Phytophthora cactorum]KAG3011113.1 hypothetical protein PC119_g13311 [Phytophthora cactorum]KAG3162306.1 hypothetical protein C6341_g13326 [Phytophthora cactorum]KAG3182591.1 hypothetical protein PC128_g14588 [Phytophthora cactorum]
MEGNRRHQLVIAASGGGGGVNRRQARLLGSVASGGENSGLECLRR